MWYHNGSSEVDMANINVKNVPDELYEVIKKKAEQNHRSINSEIIFSLELALRSRKLDAKKTISRIRNIQERLDVPPLNEKILSSAKHAGRP